MVDRIVAESLGLDVVNVGCGTGISARLFQAAGCRVLGVDPDPRIAPLASASGLDVEVSEPSSSSGTRPGGRSTP